MSRAAPSAEPDGVRSFARRTVASAAAGPAAGDGWLVAAVFAVAFLFQLPIRDRWLALLDEGYLLAIADDVNRGQVLYRDVTIDAPFPLAFHLLAAWLRWTDTSIASSRWLTTIVFSVYAAALFRVSREVLPRAWALGLVAVLLCYRVWAFPHWQVYSYSTVAATLAVVAAALVCGAVRTGSTARLALAGVAAGCAILSKQDYGGAVAFALTVALALVPWLTRPGRPRLAQALAPAATFMAGGAAVVLPFLAWTAWQGALDEMVQQTLLFPLTVMSSFAYPRLPGFWPLFGQDAALRAGIGNYFPSILATLWWNECPGCWMSGLGRGPLYHRTAFWDVALKLVFWAPFAFTAVAAVAWSGRALAERRRGPVGDATRGRLVVLALAGGFLLAFNPPRDWVHLMMVYPPSLLVGAALCHDATRRPRVLRAVTAAALLAAVGLLLAVTVALMSDLRRRVDHWLGMPRARVYADRLNGPLIEDVLAWVEHNVPPEAPLPVYPTQPALGFLAGRRTVAGYHVIWPMQAATRDRDILAALDRERVRHLLFSVSQWAHLRPFQENAPELFDELVDVWEITQVFSREPNGPIVVALEPSAPAPERTPLREVARGRGATWARWPFTDVLTQPVGTPGAPAALELEVAVPADRPVLETAVGMNPDRWLGAPIGPLAFRVEHERPDGGRDVLVEEHMDPRGDVADRGWRRVSVDLSEHAGETVTLVLSIEAGGAVDEPDGLAGWRSPAFVAAPPRDAAGA